MCVHMCIHTTYTNDFAVNLCIQATNLFNNCDDKNTNHKQQTQERSGIYIQGNPHIFQCQKPYSAVLVTLRYINDQIFYVKNL